MVLNLRKKARKTIVLEEEFVGWCSKRILGLRIAFRNKESDCIFLEDGIEAPVVALSNVTSDPHRQGNAVELLKAIVFAQRALKKASSFVQQRWRHENNDLGDMGTVADDEMSKHDAFKMACVVALLSDIETDDIETDDEHLRKRP